MKFDQIIERLNPFMLHERYYNYTFPEKKSLQMYDFYVLDYLRYLVENMSPQNFRDLPMDLEDSVKDSVNKLFPALRQELLNAVFYAVCAEMRHSDGSNGGNRSHRQLFDSGSKDAKLYNAYLKYMLYHKANANEKQELVDIHGVEKPRTRAQIPATEVDNDQLRNTSYKAARYAIKKTGLSEKDFMEMCLKIFTEGGWSQSYGGQAWGSIAKGWLMLNDADQINPPPARKGSEDRAKKPMSVAIDHVYDLQHNTDTVFNKLKSYYVDSGYGWIGNVLDHKANTHSYFDLLSHCSSMVKNMAQPILYNRLGSTWENDIKNTSPEDDIDLGQYKQKQLHTVADPINGNFVICTHSLTSNGFIKGKVYKVLNYKGGSLLLLRNDTNQIKKVSSGYFDLLVKKDGSEEEPPTAPEEWTSTTNTFSEIFKSKYTANLKTGDKLKVVDADGSMIFGKWDTVTYIKDTYEAGDLMEMIDIIVDKNGKQTSGWRMERFEPIVNWKDTLSKNPPTTQIHQSKLYPGVKTGDMLEVVDAYGFPMDKGDVIEYVEYVMDDIHGGNFVTILLKGKESDGWGIDRFKPIKKSTPINANLKKGDKVKCIDDSGWGEGVITKGKIYEVIAYGNHNSSEDDTIYFVDDNGSKTSAYASRFVPYEGEEPSEVGTFKVGDKVKLKKDETYPDMTQGKVYTIQKLPPNNDPTNLVAVSNDEDETSIIFKHRLELVKDEPKRSSKSFPIGSKVKLKEGEVYPNVTKGKAYTVVKGGSNHDPRVITYILADHGHTMGIYNYRFDPVKDRPSQVDAMATTKELVKSRSGFNVGDDIFYVASNGTTYTGKIATMSKTVASIIWDDGMASGTIPLNVLHKMEP